MADERADRDVNRVTSIMGVTDDANLDLVQLRVDPTTKRLKTTTTIAAGTSLIGSVKITDGTDDATVRDVTGAKALDVSIVDASGNQVTSFGGGTQYTEDDTDASITGTALMFEDAANTLKAATGDVSNGLDVDVTRVQGTVTVDGSGVTQPVSGTVTADLSATDNAVLDQIDSNTDYGVVTGGGAELGALRVTIANDSTGVLSIDDNGGSLTVDGTVASTQSGVWNITDISGTVSLPTGASTSANQSTIIGHVDGIETLLGTIDADTSVLAGAVSGTELQVDIVGSLPAGDNNIGNVDIASSVALDVSAATVTVQATNLDIRDLTSASDSVTAVHGITGIGHGVKTVTTAGTDEALAGSTACKRVTIQAQTDNTGWIAVGTSGVDATESTGTGVLLGAGDAFELEIDNLADVYIDSTVNGEGVRYTYFT